MRLRQPPREVADFPATPLARGDVVRRCYRVSTLTPLFGGGVEKGETDRALPVRAGALRARLRGWWRLLARARNPGVTSRELFAREAALWGRAAKEGDGGGVVEVRVQLTGALPKRLSFQEDHGRNGKAPAVRKEFEPYVYALEGARGEWDRDNGKFTKEPCWLYLPGLTFDLEIAVPGTDFPGEIEEAVRWWACFGGLGARWRRGLGAVKVEKKSEDGLWALLDPITELDDELKRAGFQLGPGPEQGDARVAAAKTLKKLKDFRQNYEPAGLGRCWNWKTLKGTKTKCPGRSYWPEADAVRDITWREPNPNRDKAWGVASGSTGPSAGFIHPIDGGAAPRWFPRACFGMPLIIHFKDEKGRYLKDAQGYDLWRDGSKVQDPREPDPESATVLPEGFSRMASPLILRAVALANGRFQPTALLLPRVLDGKPLSIEYTRWRPLSDRYRPSGRTKLSIRLDARDWWGQPSQWGTVFPLGQQRRANPLEAFLKFFMS